MEIILGVSTKSMAFTFTGHSLGYTVGAWVCGMAYDRTNKEFAFFISILLESFATVSAAFVGNLYSFIIAMSFQGLGMGFIDAGMSILYYLH